MRRWHGCEGDHEITSTHAAVNLGHPMVSDDGPGKCEVLPGLDIDLNREDLNEHLELWQTVRYMCADACVQERAFKILPLSLQSVKW